MQKEWLMKRQIVVVQDEGGGGWPSVTSFSQHVGTSLLSQLTLKASL
jgi:hypothetical protein